MKSASETLDWAIPPVRFASHSAARGLGQGAYLPLEQVLADTPQVVLAAGAERMLTRPALRGLEGVRYEQLDPALLFCGGPTVARAVERLAEVRRATPPQAPSSEVEGASLAHAGDRPLFFERGGRGGVEHSP